MTITTASGYGHAAVAASVQAAIATYIDSLPLGASLPITRLSQLAYDASPGGVTNVTGVSLNGGIADLEALEQNVIRSGTVVVN